MREQINIFEGIYDHPRECECARGHELEHVATVLQVLWREVERPERNLIIRRNEITLKTGDASIVLKSDGSVVVKGNNITVESSRKTSVKAAGDLVLKGSKVVTNCVRC